MVKGPLLENVKKYCSFKIRKAKQRGFVFSKHFDLNNVFGLIKKARIYLTISQDITFMLFKRYLIKNVIKPQIP